MSSDDRRSCRRLPTRHGQNRGLSQCWWKWRPFGCQFRLRRSSDHCKLCKELMRQHVILSRLSSLTTIACWSRLPSVGQRMKSLAGGCFVHSLSSVSVASRCPDAKMSYLLSSSPSLDEHPFLVPTSHARCICWGEDVDHRTSFIATPDGITNLIIFQPSSSTTRPTCSSSCKV